MITKVTITGADDSIDPFELVELQKEFPFVEWGILFSRENMGSPRFPSFKLLFGELFLLKKDLKLACHLCGDIVRELATGDDEFIRTLGIYWNMFERIQVNFAGKIDQFSPDMIEVMKMYPEKEFIFQYDCSINQILKQAHQAGVNCSALFDQSHGKGKLRPEWPLPLHEIKCGYAGGLSPENLKDQIRRIEGTVRDTKIWIDMETHVRSNNGAIFDLNKVRACLEIARQAMLKMAA